MPNVHVALFESLDENVITNIARTAARDGANCLLYTVDDDKLRMVLAALREAKKD